MKYVSKIFCPLQLVPLNSKPKVTEITTKSQKLLVDFGLVRSTTSGCYALLPLGWRILNKLERLVDACMASVGGQRITLPALSSVAPWKKTGRLEEMASEIFKLKDRHSRNLLLSPTHEEALTSLIGAMSPISHKMLPLRLYQITAKYRDEMRPRFGLLRAREFTMCDLYSFDASEKDAEDYYARVGVAYDALLDRIALPFCKVSADGSSMGGRISHEWLLKTDSGESRLIDCKNCGHTQVIDGPLDQGAIAEPDAARCSKCNTDDKNKLTIGAGIEVAHTFLLGDRYSSVLGASYGVGKMEPIQMGSYGIGVTRLLAAAAEAMSTEDELRWPGVLAPYSLCIIGPKEGSAEMSQCGHLVEKLYDDLISMLPHLRNDILVDDRHNWTIGKRQKLISGLGIPLIIILGKHTASDPSKFEIIDISRNESHILTLEEIVDVLKSQTALSDYTCNISKISENVLI